MLDGAEVALGIIDRARTEMLHRVRLDELLIPGQEVVRPAFRRASASEASITCGQFPSDARG